MEDIPKCIASFESLRSPQTLDTLISELADVADHIPSNYLDFVAALLAARPGIFEACITSSAYPSFQAARNRLVTGMDLTTPELHPTYKRVFDRLGAFFLELPPHVEIVRQVTPVYRDVTKNLALLANPPPPPSPVERKVKKVKKPARKRFISISEFDFDSVAVAESPVEDKLPIPEVIVAVEEIRAPVPTPMAKLKEGLEDYLLMFLSPEVHAYACSRLLVKEVAPIVKPQPEPQAESQPFPLPAPPVVISKAEKAVAYPRMAPGRAKWYADQANDSYGVWRVVIAQRAIKHFRQLHKNDAAVSTTVERKLKELAAGYFASANHTELLDEDCGVAIYQARLKGDLRLIYHIDCGVEKKGDPETQFIRVFGIYSSNHIDHRLWTSVAAQLSRRGPHYRKKCSARAVLSSNSKGVNVTTPLTFDPRDAVDLPNTKHAEKPEPEPASAADEDNDDHFLELHRILALEKFIPFSRDFFNAIRNHAETSFVFTVSPQEDEIIAHDSSCLVLGRSGTGKTTTMLFRMIALEVASDDSGDRYRQLFVTQSKTLAKRVQTYYTQLRSSSTRQSSTQVENHYQTFMSLQNADENAEDQGALPERFSELQDHHYPLFLTYDKLAKMLEADFGLQFSPSIPLLPTSRLARGTNGSQQKKRFPLISFHYFVAEIWSHFPESATKGLHPALVFSEFLGVIKGSEAAMATSEGCLPRSAYENPSRKAYSALEGERSRVYDLLELYHKRRPANSYDMADRTFALLNAIKSLRPGKPVDFMYVDEAQDNLIADAALLRLLCSNPHGLFFAGDTAQTISVGSAFRFSELKAYLHRLEREDINVSTALRAAVEPAFFQLSVNYRSHQGIVNAAAYLVSLLVDWFPNSIDSLARESAIVSGPRPVFFSGREGDGDFLRLISDKTTGRVELGAHQAIIVRDEEAAERLRQRTGRVGIILTVYESKGMEFNDVLLYDFFANSPATPTNWRALLQATNVVQPFDRRRHAILQSELKSLYVALTRAREHVWLWDSSENGEYMEAQMCDLHLASSFHKSQPVPQLAVASSTDEWAEQGHQLFNKQLYSEAAFCFEKAAVPWWRDVSVAYAERLSATRIPTAQAAARRTALINVAKEFERLSTEAPLESDRPLLDLNAAECYAEGGQSLPAAKSFYRAGRYTQAVWHYRVAGHLDDAIEVINEKGVEIDASTLESVKYAAKVDYTKTRRMDKARALCTTQDEYVEFLKDHDFESQRIQFLESVAQHEDLAEVFWQKGEHQKAVKHFLQSTHPDAPRNATACWLEGLRREIPFGSNYSTQTVTFKALIRGGKRIQLSKAEQEEVDFLPELQNADPASLATHLHHLLRSGNTRCALLAYDAWSKLQPPKLLESADMVKTIELLRVYLNYSRILGQVSRKTDLADQTDFQTLFGLSAPKSQAESATASNQILDDRLLVGPSSIIYAQAVRTFPPPQAPAPQSPSIPILVSRQFANEQIQKVLVDKLNTTLQELDASAVRCAPFEPCPRFVTLAKCDRKDCWRDHPRPASLTLEAYNARIRIILLLIGCLDLITATTSAVGQRGRMAMQGIWLSRLFEACYPANPQLGNIADIAPALIPEYHQTMPVVLAWCQEVFLRQRPIRKYPFFVSNVLISSMIATAFDYENTTKYLWHGQWHEEEAVARRERLLNAEDKPTVQSSLCWYALNTRARHNHGYFFIKHVIDETVAMDVTVLVSFIEEVSAQLILNHYHHDIQSLNGLTLPRSWIIRAVRRGPSLNRNGTIAFQLVAILPRLLEILCGKDAGDFHVRRTLLFDVSGLTLGCLVGRVCRVIALMGYNITKMQSSILEVFGRFVKEAEWNYSEPYRLYFRAKKWPEVITALQTSIPQSALDELVAIVEDFNQRPAQVQGVRLLLCPRSGDLQRKLMVGSNPSVLAIPPDTANSAVPATPILGAPEPAPDAGNAEAEDDAGQIVTVEGSDRSARIIQAFFHRTRARFGGPVASAFEQVAKKHDSKTKSRLFVLVVRGPMPHVLANLQKLADRSKGILNTLNRKMQTIDPKIDYEALDNIREDGARMRIVQKEIAELANVLQPKSALYERPSFSTIITHIQKITAIAEEVHNYDKESNGVDYDLGVVVMLRLADRVAAKKAKLEKKPKRPALNVEDVM